MYMVKEECDGLLLGAAGRACFPDSAQDRQSYYVSQANGANESSDSDFC